MMNSLKLITYNSTGLGQDKRNFISKLLDNADVAFLQEHWLNKDNLDELNTLHKDFVSTPDISCSGMPSGILRKRGRPYGGAGILYRSSISQHIKHIPTDLKNTNAIMLNNILMVNTYMPADNHSQSHVSNEFESRIQGIEAIIAGNPHGSLVIGGDINVDLARDNEHTRRLMGFAQQNKLFFVETHRYADYQYTFRKIENGTECTSTVDHFIVTEDIFDAITGIKSDRDDVDNPPGHIPVHIEFTGDDINRKETIHLATEDMPPRIAWHRVKDEHVSIYKTIINNKLRSRPIPPALFCKKYTL